MFTHRITATTRPYQLKASVLASVAIIVSMLALSSPASAQPRPVVIVDQFTTTGASVVPSWPYLPSEARIVWAHTHAGHLTRSQAEAVAQWLNAYTANLLGQYLFAVWLAALPDPHTCSSPTSCADLVRSVFSSRGLDSAAAVRVATCESGLNPNARNPSGASGLFQHLISLWPARAAGAGFPGASPFDPYVNSIAAANMVRASGWSAWVCRP